MRYLFFVLLIASLVLVACQPDTPRPLVEASPTDTNQPPVEIYTTNDELTHAPTQPPNIETVGETAPGCTVVSPRPTAGPTQESIFYPIGEDEWVTGPEDAQITLIEYSDFQ